MKTAIALSAGLGTRMRPLTLTQPKPLIEAAGRTLLDRTLDMLVAEGIERVVVNVHYLGDMIRDHLRGRDDVEIIISDETARLMETGGGIRQALPSLGSEPFIAINSDAIWGGKRPLQPLIDGWRDDMEALLLLAPRETAVGYTRDGDFFLSEERVMRRGAKPSAPFVFTGAQVIRPECFVEAPLEPFSTNVIWDRLIASETAFGTVYRGGWADAGTPAGLRAAEDALLA